MVLFRQQLDHVQVQDLVPLDALDRGVLLARHHLQGRWYSLCCRNGYEFCLSQRVLLPVHGALPFDDFQ